MRNAAISAASRFVTLDCDEAARWLVGETRCRPKRNHPSGAAETVSITQPSSTAIAVSARLRMFNAATNQAPPATMRATSRLRMNRDVIETITQAATDWQR
jgi:hypothetical protein